MSFFLSSNLQPARPLLAKHSRSIQPLCRTLRAIRRATNALASESQQQAAPATASQPEGGLRDTWALELELKDAWGLRAADAELICAHPHVTAASQQFLQGNLRLLFGMLGNAGTASLLRRHPGLLLAPLTAWQTFFTACGMTDSQFGQLLGSCHSIFQEGSIYNVGRAMVVLRTLGVSDAHLCSSIPLRYPQLLLADVDACLQPAAAFLLALNLPPATLAQITTRIPRLLTRPPSATMGPTLHHLRALPVPPAALPPLLAAHPSILAMAPADIDARLAFFRSIGLSQNAAVSVLLSCPEALALTQGNLERKWRYLHEEMGGGLEAVRRYPRYFAAGLQVEIGPRFLFVQQHQALRERLWQPHGGPRAEGAAIEGGAGGVAAGVGGGSVGVGVQGMGGAVEEGGSGSGAVASSTSRAASSAVLAVKRSDVDELAAGGGTISTSGSSSRDTVSSLETAGSSAASPCSEKGSGGCSGSSSDGLAGTRFTGNGAGGSGSRVGVDTLDLEWLLCTPVSELVAMVGQSVSVYEEHVAACQHGLAVHWSTGSTGRAVA